MRERPILFSAPMVRAILDGRKTQTRRLFKVSGIIRGTSFTITSRDEEIVRFDDGTFHYLSTAAMSGPYPCPYGVPGDRLWVRETHAIFNTHGQHRADDLRWGPWAGLPTALSPDGTQIAYFREGFDRCDPGRWRPSIHMPRWASRITLEITGVGVERLQDINEADAIAEGIKTLAEHDRDGRPTGRTLGLIKNHNTPNEWGHPVDAYRALWESINGAGSWDANPWVWVVEFHRIYGSAVVGGA